MKINYKKIASALPIIGAILLMIIIRLIPEKYSLDFLLISIVLLCSIGIYLYASKTHYKTLLRVFAVYIFINFLIFPLLYLSLLKVNPESFKIENSISKSEQTISITDLENSYSPKNLKSNLLVVNSLLEETGAELDVNISVLNNGNTIKTKLYLLSKDCHSVKARRPMYKACLNICDFAGNKITSILDKNEGCLLNPKQVTVREFINLEKDKINKRIKQFDKEHKEITEKGNYWTYNQLLSYSINTFSTGNFIPISKLANILFYLHFFIGNGILLTILIAFIQKTLEKGKET
ncbi:hypothetical protein Q4566_01605 [Tamlana sp. 2_MG-2023]|uniref:hypothetical protein n=1 Tax=unclassified Tamlana TaxID=2614803 RepID=UPI0026E34F78|nr:MULTISPECIES: hypothetical protein [unclassified Tamlana]MDO6758880.1 hypothetical protein [Tamlana sp. 2_MG-2023]MDO6789579.1 hypothetical protein [Tamlana sp. 1_MG-2023]